MAWLQHRQREPEIMDQPGLDPRHHAVALDALARINWLSATASCLFARLASLQQRRGKKTLRVLDVASGGGDVAIRLARMAASRKLDWHVEGCDFSPVAVAHASLRAQEAKADVRFFQHDALGEALPGEWDAVLCTLFLHHLADEQAVGLLRSMSRCAGMVLVSDLNRSAIGLLLAHAVGRLVTRSPVVHADGPASVRAAFTPDEARAMAQQAGLVGAVVRRIWPWRWLLSWERPL